MPGSPVAYKISISIERKKHLIRLNRRVMFFSSFFYTHKLVAMKKHNQLAFFSYRCNEIIEFHVSNIFIRIYLQLR